MLELFDRDPEAAEKCLDSARAAGVHSAELELLGAWVHRTRTGPRWTAWTPGRWIS